MTRTTAGQTVSHGVFDKNMYILDLDVFLRDCMSETYKRVRAVYPTFEMKRTLIASTPSMYSVAGTGDRFQNIPQDREVVPGAIAYAGNRWIQNNSNPPLHFENKPQKANK